jgi:hypothetical protein
MTNQNGLRCGDGPRILLGVFTGLCLFVRAGVLRALIAAARLLLASGARG